MGSWHGQVVGGRRLGEVKIVAKLVFVVVLLREQVLLGHRLKLSRRVISLDGMDFSKARRGIYWLVCLLSFKMAQVERPLDLGPIRRRALPLLHLTPINASKEGMPHDLLGVDQPHAWIFDQ